MRNLFRLSTKNGGLGTKNPILDTKCQRESSLKITREHVEQILNQERIVDSLDQLRMSVKNHKQELLTLKILRTIQDKIDVDSTIPEDALKFVFQASDKGASAWLNVVPIGKQGLVINKMEFWDALRLRYNLRLENLASGCVCGDKFGVAFTLSSKRGVSIAHTHDEIRNLLKSMLNKVCNDVMVEPPLMPLNNEKFKYKASNRSTEARLDIKAGGFWRKLQTALFNIRVSHVNCKTNKDLLISEIFRNHEQVKKRQYLQRVLDAEHGTFTPLVFGTNRGLGKENNDLIKIWL